MFKYCFTSKKNWSIPKSKYSNLQGVAKITVKVCDGIITGAKIKGIDLDLALSPGQLKKEQQEIEFEASAILYSQTKTGDLEGYNFYE